MAYISGGAVTAKRSVFRLSIFSEIFWGVVNFFFFFFQSMFMNEEQIKSTKYYRPAGSSSSHGGGGNKQISTHSFWCSSDTQGVLFAFFP